MKNLSTNRSNLSQENIDILAKIVYGGHEDVLVMKNLPDQETSLYEETRHEDKFHESALGVLYKNINETKNQRKPLIYFIMGLIIGIASVLFLSAVVFVSDKDTLENDVKSVKENIKDFETTTVNEVPTETDGNINSDVSTDSETSILNPNSEGLTVDENGTRVYIVKQGDTLGGIVNRLYGDSSKYNPSKVEKFKEINKLKSIHSLQIGQKLIIPD